MENKREELKGLLKEVIKDELGPQFDAVMAEGAAHKEANTKLLESNTELKAQLEDLQGKVITLNQNTGVHKYVFKGMEGRDFRRNLVMDVSKEVRDKEAANLVKALTEANTGAYATATEYGNALLGLAELKSVFLNKARVIMAGSPIVKLPAKYTRATVDAQAFGTANAGAALALAQITWTIDKRIGAYEVINNDVLYDQIFDVVGQWVEPAIAEGIGQNIDGEVVEKTEFTTDLTDGVAPSVEASGTTNIGNAVTYANLVTMVHAVEHERGVNPEWFMPRGVLAAVQGLVSASTGTPIFNPVPIGQGHGWTLLGYPINIVSVMDNTPDDGCIRMAFGDPSQYIIMMRGGVVIQWNPYVSMKEGMTQVIGLTRADGNVVAADAWTIMQRND